MEKEKNHPEDEPVGSTVRSLIARLLGESSSSFRYSAPEMALRSAYRRVFPVPTSPWTKGEVDDISKINLVPPERLRRFFGECIDLLKWEKGGEIGDYLEFGVFNGSSMSSMTDAMRAKKTHMRRFGFDAFQGLPADAESEDDGVWEKGFYACSFDQMQSSMRRRGVNPDGITWVKGWYEDTLTPATAEQNNIKNIGIAFIDCDTYTSSKAVLNFLAPLLSQPAIICLDDWKLNDLDIKGMGEYKSFNEFLEENPQLRAREIGSYNRKSKSFLVTP